jgi:hypothetical protein
MHMITKRNPKLSFTFNFFLDLGIIIISHFLEYEMGGQFQQRIHILKSSNFWWKKMWTRGWNCAISHYRLSLIIFITRGLGLWCLTSLSTMFQLYHGSQFYCWRKQEYQRKPPTCSHWQTSSHNVVSSTPHLSGIRTHNISGDRHWLHR